MKDVKKEDVAKKEDVKKEEVRRIFGSSKAISDKFKLLVATLIRDASYNKNEKRTETIEHCHFFRTFDSSGRAQPHCVAICGHHHEMIKIGELQYECAPILGHTHKVVYIESIEVEKRNYSTDGLKAIEALNAGYKDSV